ncbi:hypothetical protein EUTSA_v10009520mg [Eutrema salsugineum]|uniref:RRM domain-containing protein n=1 Tax=Eutrema salsugineum TaxID=72664 RepID=V4L0X4_EUTSA|nr:hypothetical protein EUTSA_v10009520mg [Eutrema salsugineum]
MTATNLRIRQRFWTPVGKESNDGDETAASKEKRFRVFGWFEFLTMGTSVEVRLSDMILKNEFGKFSLYVGDLDSSVEESDLYNKFDAVGEVSSIRICRDRNTGSSLGYAYVNFNHHSHAEKAMKELNFVEIKGKPMRIMISKRDPSMRKSGKGNVFVKNMDKSIDNKQLAHLFSSFGIILSCKVARDASGVSKGHGFVQFYSEAAHRRAINELHGTVTDADLKTIFGEFGEITSAVVMRDGKGKSRRFGFVNFKKSEAAVTAIENLNGTTVHEKELYVGRAQKKKNRVEVLKASFKLEKIKRDVRRPKGLNLYVKNLEDSVNDKKLQDLFSEFGTITSCKVMNHSNGMSKNVGFVEFSTGEEASKAMLEMNGKMVGQKPIYVSLAQRKEERRLHPQTQFNNVVSLRPSPHQHPIFTQATAPATMLPPQLPFRGYHFQPHVMFGSRLPNGFPAMHVPNVMVPQPLYPPPLPVTLHHCLQPMMSMTLQ